MPSTGGVTQLKRSGATQPRTQAKRPAAQATPAAAAAAKAPVVTVKHLENAESEVALAAKDDERGNVHKFAALCDDTLAKVEQLAKAEDGVQRKALHQQVMVQSLQLRCELRRFNYRLVHWRGACATARHAAEGKQVALMNLVHQVHHLCKEIQRCTDFKSLDEQINMVPLEQFYTEAPEEISKPEQTKLSGGHDLRLARLNYELEQRKRLSSECDELETRREQVKAASKRVAEQLLQLKPQLAALLEASQPLQTSLDMRAEPDQSQLRLCKRLPRPLFCLYLHANAYAQSEQVGKTVSVEIRSNRHGDTMVDDKADSDSLVCRVRSASPEKKSSRRGAKKAGGKRAAAEASASDPTTDGRPAADALRVRLLTAHTMSVALAVGLPPAGVIKGGGVVLLFRYFDQLNTVAVLTEAKLDFVKEFQGDEERKILQSTLSERTLLADLLQPDDSGTECIDAGGTVKLHKLGLSYCDHWCRVGRAYQWAQRLAGLPGRVASVADVRDGDMDTADCDAQSDIVAGVELIEKVVDGVVRRCRHRVALYNTVVLCKSLDLGTAEVHSEPSVLNCPTAVGAKLAQFAETTHDDYACNALTKEVAGAFTPLDYYYTARVDCNADALTALIAVPVGYPNEAPLFTLSLAHGGAPAAKTAHDDSTVKDLEHMVNVTVPLALANSAGGTDLLLAQMRALVSRFDLAAHRRTADDAAGQQSYLVPKWCRGGSRRLPHAYDNATRSFIF